LEEAFWRFVDQKWRDSLNVATAEPTPMDYGTEIKRNTVDNPKKGDSERQLKKGQVAEVNAATAEATEKMLKTTTRPGGRVPLKC
jgi:hypothetical protein